MATPDWILAEEHSSTVGTHSISIESYEHSATGLSVVFASISGSLLADLSVVVPTHSIDNKGLAHTLEHLIFCASEKYPQKGFLDQLANNSFSNGTNAYTSEDHTCYTFTTCSSAALERVLPVYLDHIFNPLLLDEHFRSEVCLVQPDGIGGVVYCEMQSRQYSEEDQLDMAIRAFLHSSESPWSVECGGRTEAIASVTLAEIVEFHRRFYTPSNCTILISGAFRREEILASLHLFFGGFSTGKKSNDEPLGSYVPQQSLDRSILFPASECDVGTLAVVWPGLSYEDFRSTEALQLLFKFFNESPASLLGQLFTEIEDPLCSSVSHDTRVFSTGGHHLLFNGVSASAGTLFSDSIPSRLFHALSTLSFSLEGFQEFLRRFSQQLVVSFEEGPTEFVGAALITGIVRSYYQPSSEVPIWNGLEFGRRCLADYAQEPREFFLQCLRKFCSSVRSAIIRMVPSREESVRVAELEDGIFKKALARSGAGSFEPPMVKIGTEGPSSTVDWAAASSMPADFPNSRVAEVHGFGRFVFSVDSTAFVHVRLLFSTSAVPDALRSYLPLYAELLLQSDASIECGVSSPRPYQQIVEFLSAVLLDHDCSIGEIELLPSSLVISFCCSKEKIQPALQVIVSILKSVSFSVDRIATVATNLQSDIIEELRDPDQMLYNYATALRFEDQDIRVQCLPFNQRKALQVASKRPAAVREHLSAIHKAIFSAPDPSFLFITCDDFEFSESAARLFLLNWNSSLSMEPIGRCSNICTLVGNSGKKGNFTYAMRSATSNYCLLSVDWFLSIEQICSNPTEYAALLLLCELLSATEGPLYRSIRGRGLAYSTGLRFDLSMQSLYFYACRSVDVERCISVFMETISADTDELLSESAILGARASLIFGLMEAREKTVSRVFDYLKYFITGATLGSNALLQLLTEDDRVCSLQALRAILQKIVGRFLQSEDRTHIVINSK